MKRIISIILTLAIVFSAFALNITSANAEESETSANFLDVFKANSTLAWYDEFEGDKVDRTKWKIAVDEGSCDEINGTEEDGNVTVSDGCLKIRAYEKAVSGANGLAKRQIQSGSVHSKAAWGDGLIEVRAKLPKGKGVFPAIWTLGANYDPTDDDFTLWPWAGEIDIMEAIGYANSDDQNNKTWQTLHSSIPYSMNNPNNTAAWASTGMGEYHTPNWGALNDEFHTFWCYRDGSYLLAGVDEYMFTIKDLTKDPNLDSFKFWEQWLVLNLQMGGSLAPYPERTSFSVWEMLIDYVRVYRLENLNDYKNFKFFEAEKLEFEGGYSDNNYSATTTGCVFSAPSSDVSFYLEDIEAGNYDVYVNYYTANGKYDVYFNGEKTSDISLTSENGSLVKYSHLGTVDLEEKCGFQLKFDYISGNLLMIDKVLLVKTDSQADVVINKSNTLVTSDYFEVDTFAELESAIERVKEKATIKLTDDITMTSLIKSTRDYTIDLNGYTLSTGNLGNAFNMPTGSTVTIKNGKVLTPGNNGSFGHFIQVAEGGTHVVNIENVDFTISAKTVNSFFNEHYTACTFNIKDCTIDFSSSANDGTTTLALVSVPNTYGSSYSRVNFISSTVIGNNNNTVFELGNTYMGSSNIKLYNSEFKNCKSIFNTRGGNNGTEKLQIFGSKFENIGSLTSENLMPLVYVDSNSTVQDLSGNNIDISYDLKSFKTVCNHNYAAATCTDPETCQYCKNTVGETPSGHKSDDGVVTREADCYYSEITTYSCTECGEVLEEKETAPIKGHNFKSELLGEITCTTMRYYKYTCVDCDYFYQKGADTDISGAYTFKGHVVDEDTKVEFNSCVNHVGYYYTCKTCGEENCKYIEHSGTHDIYSTNFTAPTESDTGKVTYKCNDCDFSKTRTIKAGEHIVTVDDVKYFTTDGDYFTPYQYSEDFLYYVDEEGNTYGSDELIQTDKDITLTTASCAHIPVENSFVVHEPTCTEKGYTEYTCSLCGDVYKVDFVDVLTSCVADTSLDVVVPPTFKNDGYTEHTCKFCGEKFKTDIIPATGSDISIDMTTLEGASIRLNDKTGLRFYTEVDRQKIAELRDEGYTVELGTLIAPYDIIRRQDLTFDLDEGYFVDVKYQSTEYYTEGTDFTGIVGSIVNIKESTTANPNSGNIVRNFVARGYAKVIDANGDSKIYYADYEKHEGRSLGYVSYMLKNDTAEFSKDIYASYADRVVAWAKKYEISRDPGGSDIW